MPVTCAASVVLCNDPTGCNMSSCKACVDHQDSKLACVIQSVLDHRAMHFMPILLNACKRD